MKTEIEKILHRHHANQLSTDNAINEVLRLFDVSGNEANQSANKKDGEVALPLNISIWRKARKMDYVGFCKWFNPYKGNDR